MQRIFRIAFAALGVGLGSVQVAWAQAEPALRHNLPFIYYLQKLDKAGLERINPAVAVVDPYDSGLTPDDIAQLRTTYRQQLFAYISANLIL